MFMLQMAYSHEKCFDKLAYVANVANIQSRINSSFYLENVLNRNYLSLASAISSSSSGRMYPGRKNLWDQGRTREYFSYI